MARVISTITDPETITNRGERTVFKAFQKALANHFLVFYSVPFIREHKDTHGTSAAFYSASERISDYRANRAPAISFNEEDRAQQKSEKKR